DADRIRVVTIDAGDGEVTLVCGAWNFDVGATVPYSPPGATLAGGFEVGEKEIRGVPSPGMICSERELGIGDDADGILVIDETEAPIGADLASIVPLPDVVFDVAVTSNRPDLMSTYGVARDLAAHFGVAVITPEMPEVPSEGEASVDVRVDDADGCPRFTAREITGVRVGPAPLWMRLRLRSLGVRPISNVVDITNYVMLEVGQPLHAFDRERLAETRIVVRRAAEGEVLRTLDGEERTLRADDLVIADASAAVGLAGVMGGEDSEVTEDTTALVLEAAHFDHARVLFTGKHHAIRTEALARFERGVDPELPPLASARATALILEHAGGEVAGDLIDVAAERTETSPVALASSEVERLLGVAVPPGEIERILTGLGFGVEGSDPFTVTIPSYRPDVTRPADLVEEVARIHGFDHIPARLPRGPGAGLPPSERLRRQVRQVVVGAGYYEVLSLDFVDNAAIGAIGFADDDRRAHPIRVRNPVSEEHAYLRTTLLPGLLDGLRTNQTRGQRVAALFEVGSVFLRGDAELPDQPHMVGFAAVGGRDATDASGLVGRVLAEAAVRAEIVAAVVPGMHPGRAAEVRVDGRTVGYFGEVHPSVALRWDLDDRVVAGEIELLALLGEASPFVPPSPMPPVVFDLAFDLPEDVPAARLLDEVRSSAGPLIERVVVFDVFSGPPLAEGRKSIGLRLTARDLERTLTDDELAPVRASIASAVAASLDGRLRGG
ncbi:MAG TPA: phenylalanine--tRNA ligase subunit beta, partial [Acidimicrobiia bacterium]|nr:phenylalanine--tRNA ligase subunit beta [Acidimicrobiia bacterium]